MLEEKRVEKVTAGTPLAVQEWTALPMMAPAAQETTLTAWWSRWWLLKGHYPSRRHRLIRLSVFRLHLKALPRNSVLLFTSSHMSWFELAYDGQKGCFLPFLKAMAFKCCFSLASYFQFSQISVRESDPSRAAWCRLDRGSGLCLVSPPLLPTGTSGHPEMQFETLGRCWLSAVAPLPAQSN